VGTFNFSAKYLSKKDSSTMLPELTEFVPATRMGIVRKVGSTRVFFYFDKTTEEVHVDLTIIQLVTILLIYKVPKI
jgi:hypothetical protein